MTRIWHRGVEFETDEIELVDNTDETDIYRAVVFGDDVYFEVNEGASTREMLDALVDALEERDE